MRYQLLLKGRYPCPRSAFWSATPSTIKSCGVLTVRHESSLKPGAHGLDASVHGGSTGPGPGGPGGGPARRNETQADEVFWLQSLPPQQGPPELPSCHCQMLHE